MALYLFVLDKADGTYPERYRAVGPDEDADAIEAAEGLTGTIPTADAPGLFETLLSRCPPGSTRIAEQARATSWATVERSYAGLFRD